MPSAVFLAVFLPATAFSLVVEVSPKQAMFRIGDRETVRCAVKDCAQTPSFSWISLEDRPLYADIQNRGSESVITYLSVESHHENTLQCKVACGGQLKQGKVTIKVFAFPEAPVISGHEHLVLGELATLRCEASPVYPAQLTEIEWWEGGPEPVKSEEGLPNSRALNSSFLFSAREKDDGRNITCRVRHHWLREVIQATVTLAVLRAPGEVQVSGPEEVQLGDALSLRCAAEGKPRPQFQWRVQRPSGLWVVLQGGQELVIRNASHSHTGQYQCLASNELGQRGASLHVSVQGPPRNTSVTLSPPQPIREGESVTLSCRTLSVPEGRLRLLHVSEGEEAELRSLEGSEISVTLPAVQLSHAGLYRCEASNRYGTHSNTTQLTVTAPPRNTTVEVFPSQWVAEGDNVTICCRSVSFPPPVVTLTKLGNVTELLSHSGTFHLTNLTASDAGDYQVNVTNHLGFHTQVFTLSVMERSGEPPRNWEELLIPAVVMGTTLASAALLLDFVCRSRRRGFYELAKGDPNPA